MAREPADFAGTFAVRAAVFVHFDGTSPPCSSRASVGYHAASSKAAAQRWKQAYGAIFPFGFMPDNFTKNLSDYYAFHQVRAARGALVIEFGEITCPKQKAWLSPRLQLLGKTLARFLVSLLSRPTSLGRPNS